MGMNPRGRSRGRNHSYNNHNNRRFNNNGPSRNTVYDSVGPAGRLRGTALQLMEKYQTAAKDALASDRVLAESCLQHAEHYMRLNALAVAAETRHNPQHQAQPVIEETGSAEAMETPMIEAAGSCNTENKDSEKPAPVSFEPVTDDSDDLGEMMKMDLSVPVSAMVENEMKKRSAVARPVPAKKKTVDNSDASAVPVKRRGRPAKKTVAEAS